MAMHFVIEHNVRADGIVNVAETARSNKAQAVVYYHDRFSKLAANDQFVKSSLMLVDEDLNQLDYDLIIPNEE